MFCEKCGKELPEIAKFCDKCGYPVSVVPSAPVSENTVSAAAEAPNTTPVQAPVQTPPPSATPTPTIPVFPNAYVPTKTPISVGGWIGRSLIPLIPIVGAIIYFIMLFVWAGDKTKEESFNNWAKAQLWVMLIGVVLAIIVAIIIGVLAASVANSLF